MDDGGGYGSFPQAGVTGHEEWGREGEKRRKTEDEAAEEGDGSEEEEGDGSGEYGSRTPEKRNDPRRPSESEVREHELTHIPFRSWCRHCVRGQGVEEPCRRSDREDGGVPEVHLDFIHEGRGGGEDVGHLGGSGKMEEGDDGNGGPEKVQWRVASA